MLNAVLIKVWSLCQGFTYRETDDGMEFTVINPLRQAVWQRWGAPLAAASRADGTHEMTATARQAWRKMTQAQMQDDVAALLRELPPEIAGENPAAKVAQHFSDLLAEAAAGTLTEAALLPNRYAKFRYWLAAVAENECRHGSRLTVWEKRVQSVEAKDDNGRSLIGEMAGHDPASDQDFAAARDLLVAALELALSRNRGPNKELHFSWFLQRRLDGTTTREMAAAHPGFSEATINQAICTVQQRVREAALELTASGRF